MGQKLPPGDRKDFDVKQKIPSKGGGNLDDPHVPSSNQTWLAGKSSKNFELQVSDTWEIAQVAPFLVL